MVSLDLNKFKVVMIVTCGSCESEIERYEDEVNEKYPFWCPECDDIRRDKYPWKIVAKIVEKD